MEGKTPEITIDAKVWDNVLKMVEIMPKLELFESIVNKGGILIDPDSTGISKEPVPDSNAFEERSKVIKAKLNGTTNIDGKGN